MNKPPFNPSQPFDSLDVPASKPAFDPSKPFDSADEPDWGGVVKTALNEARMGNGSKIRDLMADPVTQAKALPYLLPAATTAVGMPWAATKGYMTGRGLSDAALASYGKSEEIPSKLQQGLELGGSVLGDVAAIPAIAKKVYGGQIGQAEKAAGAVTRAPLKLPTSGNVGTALDELENSLKTSISNPGGPIMGPQSAKDAYAVAKYVADNPNIIGKSSDIAVQAARVRSMAQVALNQAIEGRGAPASAMASAMKAPNFVNSAVQATRKLPLWAQIAIGTGIGSGGGLLAALKGTGGSR